MEWNEIRERDIPTVGLCVSGGAELDEEGVLADVGGDALELERLETGPPEERGVCGGELPQAFGNVVAPARLLHGRDLVGGVLADDFVAWPVGFLACSRL